MNVFKNCESFCYVSVNSQTFIQVSVCISQGVTAPCFNSIVDCNFMSTNYHLTIDFYGFVLFGICISIDIYLSHCIILYRCWFHSWCWCVYYSWVFGTVAREQTSPSLTLSFFIAGIAASLSAFCYAELASHCPSAGSAHHYSYICIGVG
ncbi:unnamed protein product [Cuscuta epithymum]|uniref:Uncharacterized protein n=1 Tax=Cuscuta epithymum TaxID=186058 RepID=A0AAV0GA52_9ASTE|nr:unnamed protein product [Cuscuta epithymum]CAH9146863.1 unnamed protein product [Cuscuta epithymum]